MSAYMHGLKQIKRQLQDTPDLPSMGAKGLSYSKRRRFTPIHLLSPWTVTRSKEIVKMIIT